ncbi:MAG: hypothetical protein Q7U68_06720, partial [Candidatus Roizmanbacteria bacterium]|nr:hypothetical protein [Candidatus Roizmanbacteria bacterium]
MLESPLFRDEHFSHPNLKICKNLPRVNNLLTFISTDRKGGQNLRKNIYNLARIMGEDWSVNCGEFPISNGAIISIPRGGTPMSEGLRSVFPGYNYFLSNDGADRDDTRPILPDHLTIGNSVNLLIADAVIV